MQAAQLAEDYPAVSLDTDALDAARLLAEHRLPGLVVTNASGTAVAVLPASQVVRFIVPTYVLDDPALAGVLTESMCDRVSHKLRGKKVRDVIPERLSNVPAVAADDTVVEVATLMARLRSPLIAVMKDEHLIGIITASRLLAATLSDC
ncbi:CBS domain-containing protein [Nocardia sp. ET3-3]|uniref:CBS domain-containing protein n=1 Tax=Nocardia terrae TaxID=2675851 RepID=A0A7K1V1H1_9NOCA|nr:CBS domain-containing protein [Nocardia terrae]